MFTEQQNLDITRTALDSVFYQEFNYESATPVQTNCKNDKLFKQETTPHSQVITEIYKGPGLFPIVGETQAFPTTTPQVTNKYTAQVFPFEQAIYISKDLFDDNMHGVWARTVKELGMAGQITQDEYQVRSYRNGFSTQLTADGTPLFSAAHPLIGGGTQSNVLPTGSSALSHNSINQAIIQLAQQKNQAGIIMGQQPVALFVPPALIDVALQETDSALIADTANNAVNVFRSKYGFTVYSNPYLGAAWPGGSDTAWFLVARNHSIKRIVRKGIETELVSWQYSDNASYKYIARFREAASTEDYIGVVGSLGT